MAVKLGSLPMGPKSGKDARIFRQIQAWGVREYLVSIVLREY